MSSEKLERRKAYTGEDRETVLVPSFFTPWNLPQVENRWPRLGRQIALCKRSRPWTEINR